MRLACDQNLKLTREAMELSCNRVTRSKNNIDLWSLLPCWSCSCIHEGIRLLSASVSSRHWREVSPVCSPDKQIDEHGRRLTWGVWQDVGHTAGCLKPLDSRDGVADDLVAWRAGCDSAPFRELGPGCKAPSKAGESCKARLEGAANALPGCFCKVRVLRPVAICSGDGPCFTSSSMAFPATCMKRIIQWSGELTWKYWEYAGSSEAQLDARLAKSIFSKDLR